jgi:protein associated with RNAse G/E
VNFFKIFELAKNLYNAHLKDAKYGKAINFGVATPVKALKSFENAEQKQFLIKNL